MANPTRSKSSAIIKNLHSSAQRYAFYPLLAAFEKHYGQEWSHKITCRAAKQLSFPSKDLHKVHFENEHWSIHCHFTGLYGINSPLPHYFIFAALQHPHSDILRAFLDIFDQRLYYLNYLAWKKYRPSVQCWLGDSRYYNVLSALSGQSLPIRKASSCNLANLWGKRTKTAIVLLGLLRASLPNYHFTIKTNIHQWIKILHPEKINRMILSDTSLLGLAVLTNMRRIAIIISGIHSEQLLPHCSKHAELQQLIEDYLGQSSDYILVIKLLPKDSCNLGSASNLGSHTWLGKSYQTVSLYYFKSALTAEHRKC